MPRKAKDPEEKKVVDLAAMTQEQMIAYIATLQSQNEQLETALDVATAEPEQVESSITPAQYLEERIPFKAFKDNKDYKDDLVVIVNGERAQIQRGKTVMIKRKHWLALENAERQLSDAATVQESFENDFDVNVKTRL